MQSLTPASGEASKIPSRFAKSRPGGPWPHLRKHPKPLWQLRLVLLLPPAALPGHLEARQRLQGSSTAQHSAAELGTWLMLRLQPVF